jgi:HAD superfamily hydrolase (TIGR01509 family)
LKLDLLRADCHAPSLRVDALATPMGWSRRCSTSHAPAAGYFTRLCYPLPRQAERADPDHRTLMVSSAACRNLRPTQTRQTHLTPAPRGTRTVLFDLGGVTCRFWPARRLEALAGASGLSAEEVHRRLFASGFDDDCDRGRYTLDEQVAQISSRLGVLLDRPRLASLWAQGFEPDADVLALIDRVRRVAQTAMLSNNGPLVHSMVVELLPAVAARFDQLCFSYQVQTLKPDPQVFVRTLARLGVQPEQSVFIDDTLGHVEGARAVGMDALHFVSADALAEQLQDRGLM